MNPTSLRRASAADFRAYSGCDPDARWTADWFGYVVERDDDFLGIGVISLDPYGRFWAWTDAREQLSAILVHRAARTVLNALKAAGAGVIHCYRDEALGTSERWLKRLGFAPAPEIPSPRDKPVWKCVL